MKLKSIWGLLIAIIEIEINETLFCTRFEKNLKNKKKKSVYQKRKPQKREANFVFFKMCAH